MIVKAPVYFLMDQHFDPDEVSEVTEQIRIEFTKFVRKSFKELIIKYRGIDIELKILTTEDLKKAMLGSKLGTAKARARKRG